MLSRQTQVEVPWPSAATADAPMVMVRQRLLKAPRKNVGTGLATVAMIQAEGAEAEPVFE